MVGKKWENSRIVRRDKASIFSISSYIKNPPIDKLEPSVLSSLTRVEKLSISSNMIDKMINFPSLKYITRLSLARNNIKKISGLEEIAGTLK